MAGISGISGINEETLYYQYLINNNSASTMLNAISGNSADDDSSFSLSGLTGLGTDSSLSSLSGLTGSVSDSSFATILQKYLSEIDEASSDDLSEVAQSIQNTTDNTQSIQSTTTDNAQSTRSSIDEMNQAALRGEEYDFSSIDSIVERVFNETMPLTTIVS